ncbi:MAG: hypothetical protein ACRC41_01520 [Sarcina sp.]
MAVAIIIIIIAAIIGVNVVKNRKLRNLLEQIDAQVITDCKFKNIVSTKKTSFFNPKIAGAFLVDEDHNKIHYWSADRKSQNIDHEDFNFSEVLKCEVVQNKTTKMVQEATLVFASFKQKEKIQKLSLIITLDNMSHPFIEIPFVMGKNVPAKQIKTAQQKIKEWGSVLEIVMQRGKNELQYN